MLRLVVDGHEGSSPRVRGKPEPHPDDTAISRLIPARAGKTHAPRASPGGDRAHPRACGENWARGG